jgi:uncharacterized protein (DUF983 family)
MPPSKRTTDSSLHLPSASDAATFLARAARLRCPHCGGAPVMRWNGSILRRCKSCNFRFERSDESYFSGAMFFGLLMGEFVYGVSLLIIVWSMSPNVPWDTLMWAGPLGVLLVMIFIIPVSRVVWLSIDVMVRPVQPEELAGS